MEATGNDFEPVEDENSIDDVSNKSVGIPEDHSQTDLEEVKVEIDLENNLIELKNDTPVQSKMKYILPLEIEKTIDVDEPMDFLPKRMKF